MELPQPRPFGTEGRKTTHDFLSLYSPAQQDPRPQGGFLKTHDFLQPLEQVGKDVTKEEDKIEIKDVERPPSAAPPPPAVEHILPGGIGTYSITYFNQRITKPEGNLFMMAQASSTNRTDENNSNCSSYTGSGFTLWDESAVKKGKTGKENNVVDRPVPRESVVNMGGGPWTTSSERPSQSSSNQKNNNTTFSSPSTSQPSPATRNQSFMNMITSAKTLQEEDDDEEEEEEFIVKKEPTSHPKGNLSVKLDVKSNDQKPSTPRSKHSATEQRRRSKINDRFQKLREIIPHSDQKRDKASFLLEVIEYIQFLQDKVHKFEGYPGWNQEPSKLMPWRNPRTPEDFINQTQPTNISSGPASSMLAAKFEESKTGASPVLPINGQHLVESDISTAFREKVQQPEITNKATSLPLPLRTSIFPFGGVSNTSFPTSSRPPSDIEKPTSQAPQSPFWPSPGAFTSDNAVPDKVKDREITIESGTINISSIYSQGLLNSLTQALQTSGIDLSQANISVQIDLGKRANGRVNSSASIVKDTDNQTSNQAMPRSVVTSTGEDSGQAMKRLKTSRS